MNRSPSIVTKVLVATLGGLARAACERPPIDATQGGYRGLGMVELDNPRAEQGLRAVNGVPVALPAVDGTGPRSTDVYSNVQIPALRNLSAAQFARLMAALTAWVAPNEGCVYCHAADDLASDTVYTKVVSRRMIAMTIDINSNWTDHVGQTGVTCYTCHRGRPLPEGIWYTGDDRRHPGGFAAVTRGQDSPAPVVGLTSLPYDSFSHYLAGADEIRVQSVSALPTGSGSTIQATEQTYGLMMHFSSALGVNCTHCHNSRSFMPWEASTAARATAWYGIRLVRAINSEYIEPLTETFPPERRGIDGDAPKASCVTCHRGVARPLYGVSLLAAYPTLAGD
jgi:photosynthetic reaction center cytochrome c subunit